MQLRSLCFFVSLSAVCLSVGCDNDVGFEMPEIKGPLKLADGTTISVEQLRRGQESYTLYCRPCHGDKGNGRGPAAIGLRPPPRDFTEPMFKFGGVEAGSLPPDSELKRIVKGGLKGTAMLPWDVPDPVLDDILQYIKTFSVYWQEDDIEELTEITEDPWASKADEGIARGSTVYHGLAKCLQCHPAYATKQEIFDAEKASTGSGVGAFRPNMYEPVAKYSDAFKHSLLPPDFTRLPIKAGSTPRDLFRTIASGISGTAMPAWKGAIPDEDIWAIAHFVSHLAAMTPAEAKKMREKFASQPEWSPPTEGEEGETPTEGDAPAEGAAPAEGTQTQ